MCVKIIGGIAIGSNILIGTNAVVANDIPDNAVTVGISTKVINYNGKSEVRYYRICG